jgi:hypothetical protein
MKKLTRADLVQALVDKLEVRRGVMEPRWAARHRGASRQGARRDAWRRRPRSVPDRGRCRSRRGYRGARVATLPDPALSECVTNIFRTASAAADASEESEIARLLFPDQDTFQLEEQRRLEILLPHWDVPVAARTSAFGPMAKSAAGLTEKLKSMKGFPVAGTTAIDIMGNKTTTESEVVEVRKGSIPAAAWEIPAGYSKIDNPMLKAFQKRR